MLNDRKIRELFLSESSQTAESGSQTAIAHLQRSVEVATAIVQGLDEESEHSRSALFLLHETQALIDAWRWRNRDR